MDVKALIAFLIQGSMFLVIMAFAMQCHWSDLIATMRRPGLLIRAFVAVNVIVPVVAIAILLVFPLERVAEAGLILMAVSPLAPLAPGAALKVGGERGSIIGVYTILILLSILVVPLTVTMVGPLFGIEAVAPLPQVARVVLVSALIPIAVGLALHAALPELSVRAAPIVSRAAFAVLALLLVLIIWRLSGDFLDLMGNGTIAAFAATTIAGLAAGHLLGGPGPGGRGALAVAAATRHPGIAAVIAHANQADPRAIVAVLLFLLNGVIVSAIYQAWLRRRKTAPHAGDDQALRGQR